MEEKIKKIKEYIESEMKGLCISHDFFHIQRVADNAEKIYGGEGKGDLFLILAGAYFHESLDKKFFIDEDIEKRKQEIYNFLLQIGCDIKDIEKIIFIADNVGFGKSLERGKDFIGSIEFQIVEDADRLEGIGAINIARTFSYGGKKGRPIYDSNILPVSMNSDEEYRTNSQESTSFNHFYEKILLLKDLMHTVTGRRLAEQRHEFTKIFLEQFLAEWNGEK